MVTQIGFAKIFSEELSEINSENFNEEDIEEDSEIQSDFKSDESNPEMNIPLSTLKDQWGRKIWKKTDRFQLHIFETPVPGDSSFERKDWKVLDYSKMYFDNLHVENMCACTNSC
ncbi:hypothetical protein JTB14_005021 [Gonioctena quinquepunctata]|nr:hypothetical protein JTB14_005021 [Gonioctena quinquepunctata]